jgi:hypothetical protein
MASIINASSTGSGGIVQTADASGVLQLQSNGVTALSTSGANVTIAGTLTTASQSIAKASLPAGSILQVVNAYTVTGTTTTSGTQVDTALSATITPTSASSKILVLMNGDGYVNRGSTAISYGDMYFYIVRGATTLASGRSAVNFGVATWADMFPAQNCFVYLDSPATTSSTTYKMQISVSNSLSLSVPFQSFATMTLLEIAA